MLSISITFLFNFCATPTVDALTSIPVYSILSFEKGKQKAPSPQPTSRIDRGVKVFGKAFKGFKTVFRDTNFCRTERAVMSYV